MTLQVRALEGEKDVDSSQEEGGSTPAPAKEELQGELASSRYIHVYLPNRRFT